MGPYVVRAINAHFEFLSDSIEESFREEPHPTLGHLPPCNCGPYQELGCGDGVCLRREMRRGRVCQPHACAGTETCVFDDRCCEEEEGPCSSSASIPTSAAVCSDSLPLQPDRSCPGGARQFKRTCGENTVCYLCKADPVCAPRCLGEKDPHATWCRTPPNQGLSDDKEVKHLFPTACSHRDPSEKACLAECDPGYYPVPDGSRCERACAEVSNIAPGDDCVMMPSDHQHGAFPPYGPPCPEDCPYPVACYVTFMGEKGYGCVVTHPGENFIYFQEGEICSWSTLQAVIYCGSTEPTHHLGPEECPVDGSVWNGAFWGDDICVCPRAIDPTEDMREEAPECYP